MAYFTFEVVETKFVTVEVEAENASEAQERLENIRSISDVVYDALDMAYSYETDVNFLGMEDGQDGHDGDVVISNDDYMQITG